MKTPYGFMDTLAFARVELECLLEEIIMLVDEKVLGKCGVCHLPKPQHKMDCYREYTKARNKQG